MQKRSRTSRERWFKKGHNVDKRNQCVGETCTDHADSALGISIPDDDSQEKLGRSLAADVRFGQLHYLQKTVTKKQTQWQRYGRNSGIKRKQYCSYLKALKCISRSFRSFMERTKYDIEKDYVYWFKWNASPVTLIQGL